MCTNSSFYGLDHSFLLVALRVLIEEPAGAVLRFLHKLAADLLDQLPPVFFADRLELLLLVDIEQRCDQRTEKRASLPRISSF